MKNIRKTFGLATIAGAFVVAPMALATGTANADSGVNWDAVAACESGGNWGPRPVMATTAACSSRMGTWHANGGQGSPAQASRDEQIRVAENVLRRRASGRGRSAAGAASRKAACFSEASYTS